MDRPKVTNVFIDIETTGFPVFGASVIALGCVCDSPDGDDRGTFYETAKPTSKKHWSPHAEEVHGFSYKEAMKFQDPKLMLLNFMTFIDKYRNKDGWPMNFWYHGRNGFDFNHLFAMFFSAGWRVQFYKLFNYPYIYSTLDLVKSKVKIPKYNLKACCDYFGIELDHHNALSDAKACHQLWEKCEETL